VNKYSSRLDHLNISFKNVKFHTLIDSSDLRWFSAGIPVSSTNKTDCHDITEVLLKVAVNTINQPANEK
jgi:hypothetical protein